MRMRNLCTRIASLALVLAILAPALFIVAEAQHDCPGDNCEICQVLSVAVAITHSAADVPAASFRAMAIVALAVVGIVWSFCAAAHTLVGLKVRLDC